MKKTLSLCLIMLSVGAFTTSAWAHHKKNPCKAVWKACEAAGKKGKDAKACVKTIKGGGTVDGVTVSDEDVAACRGGAAQPSGAPAGSGGNG